MHKEPVINREKIIAIGSGKGGVGKSTTAVNLSIHYAKKGLRVALIDLDPLSDIETILDLAEPESALDAVESVRPPIRPVFHNLDLVFADFGQRERDHLSDRLSAGFLQKLDKTYDVLILDLPAGGRKEDNLVFLPFISRLVVVTNAEPTAHVSAGGYIREVLRWHGDLRIFLWHNKYSADLDRNFVPDDVIGNYNRNVGRELRIPEDERARIENLAYIPQDPSLDLLQSNPSIVLNVLRNMVDILEAIDERRIRDRLNSWGLTGLAVEPISYYLLRHKKIGDTSSYLNNLLTELSGWLQRQFRGQMNEEVKKNVRIVRERVYSLEGRKTMEQMLELVKQDDFRQMVLVLIDLLTAEIDRIEEEGRPFAVGRRTSGDRRIDRSIGRLLIDLNTRTLGKYLLNISRVLLYYFGLYKLAQAKTVRKLILDFIPKKRDAGGKVVRDKFRQIRQIVENDEQYHRRYLGLVKLLFPLICRQVVVIVRTFGLSRLAFRRPDRTLNREVYLKLLMNFLHDSVNSGLSIVIGFPYRPASTAFEESAERLLEL